MSVINVEAVARMLRARKLCLTVKTYVSDLRWAVYIERLLSDDEASQGCSDLYNTVALGMGAMLYDALLAAVQEAQRKGYLGDKPIAQQIAETWEPTEIELDF